MVNSTNITSFELRSVFYRLELLHWALTVLQLFLLVVLFWPRFCQKGENAINIYVWGESSCSCHNHGPTCACANADEASEHDQALYYWGKPFATGPACCCCFCANEENVSKEARTCKIPNCCVKFYSQWRNLEAALVFFLSSLSILSSSFWHVVLAIYFAINSMSSTASDYSQAIGNSCRPLCQNLALAVLVLGFLCGFFVYSFLSWGDQNLCETPFQCVAYHILVGLPGDSVRSGALSEMPRSVDEMLANPALMHPIALTCYNFL